MNSGERLSLDQIRAFLKASEEFRFLARTRKEVYEWVTRTLTTAISSGRGPWCWREPTRALTPVRRRSARSDARIWAGIRFFKLDSKIFTFSVKTGFFRTPGLPARIEAILPTACVVAAVVGVANNMGYGPFTVLPLSHHSEPFTPGARTCSGAAYTFQIPGPLVEAENAVIPMRVQEEASIRCIYAYVQQGTSDGQSAYLVKISRDAGQTWEPLEYMGIALRTPTPYRSTYDLMVEMEGYGKPDARRLPYGHLGIFVIQEVSPSGAPQTVQTASYGANRLGFDVGEFIHIGRARQMKSMCGWWLLIPTIRHSLLSLQEPTPLASACGRPSGLRPSCTKVMIWCSTFCRRRRPSRARTSLS
jgi:hypothetical protein